MIGYLAGVIKLVDKGNIILLVGGVGYKVAIPARILPKIQTGEKKEFYIYSQVREDAFNLYGFETKDELDTFEMLIGVSGVGPKIGLSLLSAENPEKLKSAIFNSDLDFFTQVPGIGKKNAQRIIVELRNKVGSQDESVDFGHDDKEVTDALSSWGFKAAEIKAVMKEADRSKSSEEQIKWALKNLSKK